MDPGSKMDAGGIERASELLRGGAVVAVPTGSYYALAADPRQQVAIDRLARLKPRSSAQPYGLMASGLGEVGKLCRDGRLPPQAARLTSVFWPGPLTLVLPGVGGLDPRCTGQVGDLAIRVPGDEWARKLTALAGGLLTATSANEPGKPPSTSPKQVEQYFGEGLPVLDSKELPGGEVSTIVGMLGEEPGLVREGAVPWAEVLGALELPEVTLDGIFRQAVRLYQHGEGYRFAVDSVLLAWFASRFPWQRAVDLGCGCGVAGLGALHLRRRAGSRDCSLLGVERQPGLALLAWRNYQSNGADGRSAVLRADLRRGGLKLPTRGFDLVLANPPYRPTSSGRISCNLERAAARNETAGGVEEVCAVAARLLNRGGRLCLVYPSSQLPRLFAAISGSGLASRELLLVRSRPGGTARIALVSAGPGKKQGKLEALPELTMFEGRSQSYTSEATAILDGAP